MGEEKKSDKTVVWVLLVGGFIILAGIYVLFGNQPELKELPQETTPQVLPQESIKPSREEVVSNCDNEAQDQASQAYKDKVKANPYSTESEKNLAEKDYYYKDDYDFSYKQCLRSNGIED